MASSNDHYPRFTKGSPSAHYLQISNFSVNYLEALLVNLMHIDLPTQLEKPAPSYEALQKQLLTRERTVRHAFQFQIEKLFSDFKLIRRTRLNANRASDWLSLGLAGQSSSQVQHSIETIANKYQKQFDARLQTLLKRLKTLVHRTDEVMDDNPLSPLKLCHAFYASFEALNLTSMKTCQIFELFDHILDDQLGNFYIQMDLGMYYLDILPELTDPALFTTAPEQTEPENDETQFSEPELDLTPVNDREQILLINRILKTRKKVLEKKNQHLNKVEQQLQQFRQAIAEDSFDYASLFIEFQQNIEGIISPQQHQEIQKFTRYFSNLLNNSLLSEPFTRQLSRLSCVLVEMVMIEPDFFSSISHPVNDFVQSIIDFEIRIKHQGNSLHRLSQIIDSLVSLQNPTVGDFKPSIDAYEQFKDEQINLLIQQIEEQKRHDKILKQEVLQQVNEITQSLVVDRETLSFFYDDWQILLLQIARKIGLESDEFTHSLEIARMLSWTLDENRADSHPEYSDLSFTSLLKAIDKGLNSMNFSSEHRNRTRKQLVKEFKQCNNRTSISVVSADQQHATNELSQFSMMISDKSSQLTDMNKRSTVAANAKEKTENADRMELGTWVEIKINTSKPYKRAKLKWKSLDNSQFIFVDQRGHKVKQTLAYELERELAAGSIKVLNTPSTGGSKTLLGSGYDCYTDK